MVRPATLTAVVLPLPRRWLAALPLALLPLAAPPVALLVVDALEAPLAAKAPEPVLRVLLGQGTSFELAAGSQPLSLADARGRSLLPLAAGERLQLQLTPEGLQAVLPSAATPTLLPVPEVWLQPAPGRSAEGLFLLGERRFRGRLQLRPEGSRLQAINHVALESYLASVVGSEMPARWPAAALRAQAVAARTYALSQRKAAAAFDLKATVASQVYAGLASETVSTRRAVASTRSLVLIHGGQLINAVFHSSSGGSTENSGDVWSRQLPYLVSVPDFDTTSPVSQWQSRFEPEQLRRAFRETDGVRRIDVLASSASGRIKRARVIGPAGAMELTGAELRQRLGLRSTLVRFRFQPGLSGAAAAPADGVIDAAVQAEQQDQGQALDAAVDSATGFGSASISPSLSPTALAPPPLPPLGLALAPQPSLLVEGRGFGHGVGMSQWGAFALAQQGRSYEQILRHYYRGVALRPFPGP
jgi:stage II sporulation protein D